VIDAARAAVPEVPSSAFLDCGDRPGVALATIRVGIEGLIFTGSTDVAVRLADIACQHGLRLITERPIAALDFVDDFFASEAKSEQRCTRLLGLDE
jgi:acyl-CoA reductase-like NAD-dependent aldehyde dehydrogenase